MHSLLYVLRHLLKIIAFLYNDRDLSILSDDVYWPHLFNQKDNVVTLAYAFGAIQASHETGLTYMSCQLHTALIVLEDLLILKTVKDFKIQFHSKSCRNLRLLTKITEIVLKPGSNQKTLAGHHHFDVLSLHKLMEEFERKQHDDSIPMKIETIAAITKKPSSQSMD